jgi:septal ring-binding cell division protein DamX
MLFKGVLALCIIVLLTIGAYWQPANSTTDQKATKMRNSIEMQARKAKDNQEQSIRLLADALFQETLLSLLQ